MARKKRRKSPQPKEADLNIMPFIDIFSMLNTFLLVSAAFINIGLIEVQIPFLTNAPPPENKPPRSLDVHVAVEKDKVELESRWSAAPVDEKKTEYTLDEPGLLKLHKDVIALRQADPESDKLNVHSEDDVPYKTLVKVLDSVMLRQKGDPVFEEKEGSDLQRLRAKEYIYRKVIMAGVIL